MAKLTIKQIQQRLREILDQSPGGVRWMEMHRAVREPNPETPENTIHGAIQAFVARNDDIVKIARGTYMLRAFQEANEQEETVEEAIEEPAAAAVQVEEGYVIALREADFYAPFAEWLRDELDEVNEVVALGGNILRGKWGTPDVLGVLKPRRSDLVKFESQIVSAEIKIDPIQPIVAFGQVVSYRLFSHKSYIVVPETTAADDLSRLEALAMIYGLGLVTFTLDSAKPNFTLRIRALTAQPDMFYVNQMAKRILDHAPEVFERLF